MLNRVLFLIYSHHDEHSFPHLSRLYRCHQDLADQKDQYFLFQHLRPLRGLAHVLGLFQAVVYCHQLQRP